MSLSRTLTLALSLALSIRLTGSLHLTWLATWTLISALLGGHRTGATLALVTTLEATLTLAKAPAPWGAENTTDMGPTVVQASLAGMWNVPRTFKGPETVARWVSGGPT